MVTKRTAEKLNRIATVRGIAVRVASDQKTKRTWYSVGLGQPWHQICGFRRADNCEKFVKEYPEVKND
jgi:hypothetical protein